MGWSDFVAHVYDCIVTLGRKHCEVFGDLMVYGAVARLLREMVEEFKISHPERA